MRDLRSALMLEVVTVAWNLVECAVSVAAGVVAGSVVLLGYGLDSLIEMTSGVVVGLRLRKEIRGAAAADLRVTERRAARAAGALLLVLAATILFESLRRLFGAGAHPHESPVGIVLTAIAAAVMPVLGLRKLRLAHRLASESLRIEAEQTIACAWFSLTTLAGLLANALLGWWWADPIAALALVPWMAREGAEPWRR